MSKARWVTTLGILTLGLGLYLAVGGLQLVIGDPPDIACYNKTNILSQAIGDESNAHFPKGEFVLIPSE